MGAHTKVPLHRSFAYVRTHLAERSSKTTLALNSALLGLALMPIVAAFAFVARYGVNIPYLDDWDTVKLIDERASGTLSLSDIFLQHNEHRIVFPRLLELGLATVDSYNTRWEMYVVVLSSVATLIVFALAARRSLGRAWLFLLPLIAYLTLSLRQHENFLWGFQVAFAFVEVFAVLALYFVWAAISSERRLIEFFACAGLCAVVATYSGAQGLLVWPAGLIPIFLASGLRKKWHLLGAWTGLALATVAFYFHGYHAVPSDAPSYVRHHPLVACRYFLMLLGASVFSAPMRSFLAGVAVFGIAGAAVILTVRRGEAERMSFWLAVFGFSTLALLMVMWGRTAPNADRFAVSSRYTSFSLLALAALFMLVSQLALRRDSLAEVLVLAGMTAAVLLILPRSYDQAVRAAQLDAAFKKRTAFLLYTYRSQPDELLRGRLFPSAEWVRQYAPVLERKHYSVFAERRPPFPSPLPPPPSRLQASRRTSPCSLDSINGQHPVPSKPLVATPDRGFLVVVGWCIDASENEAAGGVYVKLDGKYFPAYYGTPRPDVADAFHNSRLVYSGFEAAVPAPRRRVGEHLLSAVALSPDAGTSDGSEPGRYYRPTSAVRVVAE